MFRTRRVVLSEHPGLLSLTGYARLHDWQLIAETPAGQPKIAPRELIFKAGRTSLEVHYCEDDITGNSYVFATGATRRVADALIGMIERDLPVHTADGLLEAFDQASGFDDLGSLLIKLTLAAPAEFDAGIADRVRRCLQHPDERLRALAVWATSYTPWPEYQQLLREVAAEDASRDVRSRAARMLAAFDAAR